MRKIHKASYYILVNETIFLFCLAKTYLASINSDDMRREIYTIRDSRPVAYKMEI